jgi:hypothetical protein
MEPNGRTAYHLSNSPTIIATKLVFKWPPSKPYMDVNAGPLSIGRKLEKAKYSVLISSRKLKSKYN